MKWRKITADQYRKGEDPQGDGWDEAKFTPLNYVLKITIWDVGAELVDGQVSIETARPDPILVDPDHVIWVR